jgi:uncharacterized protein (UPF0248 family)
MIKEIIRKVKNAPTATIQKFKIIRKSSAGNHHELAYRKSTNVCNATFMVSGKEEADGINDIKVFITHQTGTRIKSNNIIMT